MPCARAFCSSYSKTAGHSNSAFRNEAAFLKVAPVKQALSANVASSNVA
jgi:hypothetical protein